MLLVAAYRARRAEPWPEPRVRVASAEGQPLWAAALSLSRQYLATQDKIIDAVNRDAKSQAREISMGSTRQVVADARATLQKIVDLNRRRLTIVVDDGVSDAVKRSETLRK